MPFARLGRSLWARPTPLLVVTALIWAGNAVAARALAGEVSPMATTALRWLLALVLIGLVAGRAVRDGLPELRRHWRAVFAFGAVGYTGFNVPLYMAGQTTTAVNIGMVQGIMPALVMAGSVLVYRNAVSGLQVAGLALGFLGLAVIVGRGDPEVLRHLSVRAGDLWVVLASLLYAAYTVALRVRPPVPPLALMAGMSLGAFVSSLPLLGWEVASGRIQWPGPAGWVILAFLAIFPSLVSQLFFMRGVELMGPARAGLFVNLVPVFAALLGVLVLGETFAPYHAVALALVLGGIWLAERGRRPPG